MNSQEIRRVFLEYFRERGHDIVPSAPMVNKDDPTLMFTNAGMNQFKDYFLGNRTPKNPRIADTQKCLRVSGKHNDLEEVGRDSYHHTMFEMLGNWSFGDYFKKEAIDWAWDLLVNIYQLPEDRLYATVFGGDAEDNLPADEEAESIWTEYLPSDHILRCGKKDNFWEMGDVGPCGPCSEIHIDLRTHEERSKVAGRDLVNQDDPLVVEIWNLVFIQFNRLANGTLQNLPAQHVDTGMGFERLTMAMQGVTSNYDTDIFTRYIDQIAKDSNIAYTGSYTSDAYTDIAMRVIADHTRAACFAIADGAIPASGGAGYVIRRIIRRAVRYCYSYLHIKEPYLHRLVSLVIDYYSDVFPELQEQEAFITRILLEEEKSFLNTLEQGLRRLDHAPVVQGRLDGAYAFELYDTYGFPLDLTQLIADEKGWSVDVEGFNAALAEQKARSRQDAQKQVGDWHEVQSGEVDFIGYDASQVDDAHILKYRTVETKAGRDYQIVIDKTPFYAEGGGQIGDQGRLYIGQEKIDVLDTNRENELIIHHVSRLPHDPTQTVRGEIDYARRQAIERNHSATHLLHAALKRVLGDHVQQKGSLVAPDYLRFDFSHFSKVSEEELRKVEHIVNEKIRQNIPLEEVRSLPIEEARAAGATMLFGEKYGDTVRMITFDADYSRELCGGCHVMSTGHLGMFFITSESAVASGVRRIEAVTGAAAEHWVDEQRQLLTSLRGQIKQQDMLKGIRQLQEDNVSLMRRIDELKAKMAGDIKGDLIAKAEDRGDYRVLIQQVADIDAAQMKDLTFQLEHALSPSVIALASVTDEKPTLMLAITKALAQERSWHAGQCIKEASKHIKGGGGGQPFFATAGGSDSTGVQAALDSIKSALS